MKLVSNNLSTWTSGSENPAGDVRTEVSRS